MREERVIPQSSHERLSESAKDPNKRGFSIPREARMSGSVTSGVPVGKTGVHRGVLALDWALIATSGVCYRSLHVRT